MASQQFAKTDFCGGCQLYDRPCIRQKYVSSVDIMFVGSYPMESECYKIAFSSKNSSIVRSVVNQLKKECKPGTAPTEMYTYACLCSPVYDKSQSKFLINTELILHCSALLKNTIDHSPPKVIVALGGDALKALGFKGEIKDMRGGIFYFRTSSGTDIPVVVTFHAVTAAKKPGFIPTFKKDIKKAFLIVQGGLKPMEMNIRTPKTAEVIVSELDKILEAAQTKRLETGRKLAVAVDTETTGVSPYCKEDRVIAVSMSHAEAEGLAYPFQHRDCPFTDEDFNRIRAKTEEVLSSPNISLVFANAKFDVQWLRYHYGFRMNDPEYDVMLAEHILDEDKKGNYSLKAITCDRYPSLGKYEQELHQHLDEKFKAKDDAIKELQNKYRSEMSDTVLAWWVGLNEEERKKLYLDWVEKGYMDMNDSADMVKVQYRKLKGEMVIPKKYQAALNKFLTQVPLEELCEIPKLEIPTELTIKSFEDADLDILLRYAAIDAITTRLIVKSQNNDFSDDIAKIRYTEQVAGVKLQTRSCYEPMYDNTLPLCSCLADMEYNGILIDRDKCEVYSGILKEKIAEAEDVMFTTLGRKFNTSASSHELASILYEELKLPIKKYTEKGAPSTDADTIKDLSDEYRMPFLDKLLVFRKLDKCLHTYIEGWLDKSSYDGKLHTSFLQHGTATFRLSSKSPNLQNVPYQLKEADLNLKELFLPDSDEFELYDLDIQNAEMRVLTAYSRDEKLTSAFNHGKDLHCLTAEGISNYSYEDIKKNKENKSSEEYRLRQLAKKVNTIGLL